jgi:hypothetical protein
LVQQLIAAIRAVAGLDDGEFVPEPSPVESAEDHVNGWDEEPALSGAGEEANAVAH